MRDLCVKKISPKTCSVGFEMNASIGFKGRVSADGVSPLLSINSDSCLSFLIIYIEPGFCPGIYLIRLVHHQANVYFFVNQRQLDTICI